jgi:hypothetical protein
MGVKPDTVGNLLHGFVVAQLNHAGRPQSPEIVFAELREPICDQLGIEPERVMPAARLIQDLGID